jgi:hypothetical protein
MKIHMQGVTLLSVLFATSSVLAADDAQQNRQLRNNKGKKLKKKVKKIIRNTNVERFRIVLDSAPIVLSADTFGPPPDLVPVSSVIGSRSTVSGRVFLREDVNVGEGGELDISPTPGLEDFDLLYTQLCTITKGIRGSIVLRFTNDR